MTQYLPPNLLALFVAREPLPFLPPPCKLPHEKKNRGYVGVADFLDSFEDPSETPAPCNIENKEERIERRRREKTEQAAYKLEQEIAVWDPHSNPTTTLDPYKTLFVARINYDTSESKLRREFEFYGAIKKIVLVHDKISGKPRGYAFIEYEHERDMHSAYKHADGKKIDGRRVLVDVERGRTVKGWLPRRLGGGLGGTRRGGPEVNLKHSGREDNDRERERFRAEREREPDREREGRMREWAERERERDRVPEREKVVDKERRPRSRSRERRRRSRSRSRERKRRRSREKVEAGEVVEGEEKHRDRDKERDRERDRDRDRDRRDRDRKRSRRSRSRDRKHRRDRERDRDFKEREKKERDPDYEEKVKIKVEPPDDYPDYSNTLSNPSESMDIDASKVKDEDESKGESANNEGNNGEMIKPLRNSEDNLSNGGYEDEEESENPQAGKLS